MKRSACLVLAALLTALLAAPSRAASLPLRITVDAGSHPRSDTPVSLDLPDLPLPPDGVTLVELAGNERTPVPAQLEPGKPNRLHWILTGSTAANAQRTFELIARKPAAPDAVTLREDPAGLDVLVRGAPVLRFQHAVLPAPAGASPLYARSGFVHPVWSPAGKVLSRVQPPDHYHHLGLWNPWTSTEFEGKHVDFWNLKDGTGTVRFVKYLARNAGPVFGGFKAAQDHVALNAPGGEKVALNEQQELRVWNVGGPDKGYWLADFITTQRCASQSPLKLLQYRYGGLGFRGTADWKTANSDYLTSEGKNRKNGHGTRARWCMVFGETRTGPAGIEFMSHPKNRAHPEPLRIWPSPGDIFVNFCPIQQEQWTFEPGNDYTLRYRLYIFDGTTPAETAERLWNDFANPPKASIVTPKPVGDLNRARIVVARTDISVIQVALDVFEVDTGRFPTSEEGLAALVKQPPDLKGWRGPYLRKDVPRDPWGNAYLYRAPGQHNANGFDLCSLGPDGREGNDDIDNWSRP